MNGTDDGEALARFAPRFFGPGNRLDWNRISSGTLNPETQQRIEPWIADLRAAKDPLILPRVHASGSVEWYAFSRTERGARVLREQLVAFLGSSYSDFDGLPTQLDPSDPVEAAVQEISSGRAFRIRIPDSDLWASARARLLLLRALLAERPLHAAGIARPTGRILSDFELALRSGDGAAAAGHIEELQRLGRLSAQNQLFLEVLRWESIGDWPSITNPARLGLLVDLPRPRRVTRALVRGIYRRDFLRFEDTGDARGALEHFARCVLPVHPPLFRTCAGMDAPEITKSFLMFAAAASPPRPALRDALLAAYPRDARDRSFVEALAALVPGAIATAPDDRLASAKAAYDDGDVERAFQEALAAPSGVQRLVLLLRCAKDLDTLDAAARAVKAVESAPPAARAALLERAPLRSLWEHLVDLTTPAPPGPAGPGAPRDVLEWLSRLRREPPWNAAVEVVERGAREWSRAAWLGDAARVLETASALDASRPPWGEDALRAGVPHLLTFFLDGDPPTRTMKPVLVKLAEVLVLDEEVRFEQLEGLREIVEALLHVGLSPVEYRAAIDWLRDTWPRLGAATLGDWLLDTLDTLIEHPAADPHAREAFFYDVTSYLRRHLRRTTVDQRELLAALAAELGAEVPADLAPGHDQVPDEDEPSEGTTLGSALIGRSVALYSLKESVLDRVAEVLTAIAPGVHVACFHDKVGGSSALKHQAATADVFVVATAAAKHAATNFIAAHRPAGAPTLFAAGQGSASMLRVLRQWATTSVS